MSGFAVRLQELREQHRLTHEQLARRINKSRTTVTRYLSGQKMPDPDGLAAIADAFGVSIDYLLGRSDVPGAGAGAQYPVAIRVRSARENAGLTLDELAERTRTPFSSLADIELGRTMPTAETLARIAEALNVTVDYLLGRTEVRGPVRTQAAHREEGYEAELSAEALKSIEEFKEFIRRKYGGKEKG